MVQELWEWRLDRIALCKRCMCFFQSFINQKQGKEIVKDYSVFGAMKYHLDTPISDADVYLHTDPSLAKDEFLKDTLQMLQSPGSELMRHALGLQLGRATI